MKNPEFAFVVTYGRSGSTLVQGLLNSLPRTLMRGENGLFVVHFFRAWERARTFRRKHVQHGSANETSAFYGLREVKPAKIVALTRQLLVSQMLGDVGRDELDVIGFKEVAWHLIETGEFEGFFTFFEQVFPGVKYVLNQRDHAAVTGSGFWQQRDPEEALAEIHRVEEIQEFLRTTRPEKVVELRYEILTGEDQEASGAQLRELSEFIIGRCDDAILETLRETMKTGHGPNPFVKSRGRRQAVRKGRRRRASE
ncbi:MAG: sulfotransferase [Nocardioides sp.]|nr:sulfotransferase [Nocardioides sp.]